jgi:hypothetical protein
MVNGSILENYLRSCRLADLDTFKRNPHLNQIWEHTNDTIAWSYYEQVKKENPWLLDMKFTNDQKGGAVVKDFEGRKWSNSTIQYIGVLSNLVREFGPLNSLKILELGGGYGGQAKTIYDVYTPSEYHIIDLPQVCGLVNRYFPKVKTMNNPTGEHYDLFISNYALSELRDNEKYIDQLKKCKHGYVTCNTPFVKLPFPHKRIDDIKGERETNFILIW